MQGKYEEGLDSSELQCPDPDCQDRHPDPDTCHRCLQEYVPVGDDD